MEILGEVVITSLSTMTSVGTIQNIHRRLRSITNRVLSNIVNRELKDITK